MKKSSILLITTCLFFGCATGKDQVANMRHQMEVDRLEDRVRTLESRLSSEMASKEEYQKLLNQKMKEIDSQRENYQRIITRLENEVSAYSKKLQQPETIDKLELIARLEEMEKSRVDMEKNYQSVVLKAEEKAYYQGQLSVWQSLSINSYPSSQKEGWFTTTNYLQIEIKAQNHVFFRQTIKTEKRESGFSTAFDAVCSVGSMLPYFKLIR